MSKIDRHANRGRLPSESRWTTTARWVATIGSIAAISACAHRAAPPKASAEPAVPGLSADALIVNLDDVRRIANFDDLAAKPDSDTHQPAALHDNDSKYPLQCHVVFDQDVAFSSGYKQFRSTDYTGASNKGVTQAVGIYASPAAAREAFEQTSTALTACAALSVPDLPFTTRKLDPFTIARCSADQCSHLFRVKSSVVIAVDVVHFGDEGNRIANTVLQTISDRINTA